MFGDAVPVECFVHVLHAFSWQQANLQNGDCAEKASQLLDRVTSLTDDPAILMQSYDWVLEAWSKSGSTGSAEKAQELFDKMKTLNATLDTAGEAGQIFDAETYCNAILAWSKTTEAAGAERAHKILVEMKDCYLAGSFPADSEPSLIAFNGVISAWGRQGRADRAEQILFEMDRLVPLCQDLVPDAMSYNSVLYAHLKSPDKEKALQRALSLVQHMEDHHHDQPAIKPNGFTYNTLMKCWIQSGREDLAEQAEATLVQMEKLWRQGDASIQPNNRIFNMVINAYAKSNDQYASRKAYSILARMKSSSDKKCRPDVISYTTVIECLSKSADPDAPAQAEALLAEAFARYNKTGNPRHRPNLRTFTMAILTLARANGSVVKARELLTTLLDLYEQTKDPDLMPNEYPYNYVLNCAANTLDDEKKADAFQIATLTYQDMRKSSLVRPDSFTYAFWLKCCNNLLPPGELRTKCVSYSFEECKKEGLVSKEVLARLYQGNPPALVDVLLEYRSSAGDIDSKRYHVDSKRYRTTLKPQDLPRTWTRSVAQRQR
jgi:pentatricopeptide repeat protein